MDLNNQKQISGNNSNQFQNCPITFVSGISEERVRAIFCEMYEMIKKEFTQEALDLAKQRIEKFERIVTPKLMESEERMNALKDPAFQFLLREANKKAACIDSVDSYRILSEMLVHKAKDMNTGNKNAGISVAISVLDQIDDIALRGLTLAYVMEKFTPNIAGIKDGLLALDDLYGSIIKEDSLPDGIQWLENLDLLKCIRVSNIVAMSKYVQLLKNSCNGYFCSGIRKESKEYEDAIRIINDFNLPANILIEHELVAGSVRVAIVNKESILKLGISHYNVNEYGNIISEFIPFTIEQVKAIEKLNDLCNKNNNDLNIDKMIEREIKKYHNISKATIWWDSIQIGFNLSVAGRALAHANAARLNSKLPPFED